MARFFCLMSLVGLVPCILGSGCISSQLQRDTAGQARSLSDLYEQQVLDNLAKFVHDIHSLPHFSIASAGSDQIQDQYNASGNSSWAKGGILNAAGFSLGAQRQQQDAWTTVPVSDPRKLELMQCAYQRAVSACLGTGEATECPECSSLINLFYTAVPNKSPTAQLAGTT